THTASAPLSFAVSMTYSTMDLFMISWSTFGFLDFIRVPSPAAKMIAFRFSIIFSSRNMSHFRIFYKFPLKKGVIPLFITMYHFLIFRHKKQYTFFTKNVYKIHL